MGRLYAIFLNPHTGTRSKCYWVFYQEHTDVEIRKLSVSKTNMSLFVSSQTFTCHNKAQTLVMWFDIRTSGAIVC